MGQFIKHTESQYESYQSSDYYGQIKFAERPFESQCFSNTSFEILAWDTTDFAGLFKELVKDRALKTGDLMYLRLPADDILSIHAAEQAGFYFVECSIVPSIRLGGWNRDKVNRFIVEMTEIDDGGLAEVELIAKDTFRHQRFNLDPNIGAEKADRRYLQWVRNAYAAGQKILTIKHRGAIAGFSLIRDDGNGIASYLLAGLRPDLNNAGLGMMLYASTMAHCQDNGFKRIDGGISMSNTAVLNVMAGLGFSFRTPSIVLHYYHS